MRRKWGSRGGSKAPGEEFQETFSVLFRPTSSWPWLNSNSSPGTRAKSGLASAYCTFGAVGVGSPPQTCTKTGHASPARSDTTCDENNPKIAPSDTYATELPAWPLTNLGEFGEKISDLSQHIGGSCRRALSGPGSRRRKMHPSGLRRDESMRHYQA